MNVLTIFDPSHNIHIQIQDKKYTSIDPALQEEYYQLFLSHPEICHSKFEPEEMQEIVERYDAQKRLSMYFFYEGQLRGVLIGHWTKKYFWIDLLCSSLKGTGSYLVNQLIQWIRIYSIYVIRLQAGAGTEGFYKRLGFETEKEDIMKIETGNRK